MLPIESLLLGPGQQMPAETLDEMSVSDTCPALCMLTRSSDLHEAKIAKPNLSFAILDKIALSWCVQVYYILLLTNPWLNKNLHQSRQYDFLFDT